MRLTGADRTCRVAFEVTAARIHTTVNTLRLTGWGSLRRRLLEARGYQVVAVPLYRYQALGRDAQAKVRYVQELLAVPPPEAAQREQVPRRCQWDEAWEGARQAVGLGQEGVREEGVVQGGERDGQGGGQGAGRWEAVE